MDHTDTQPLVVIFRATMAHPDNQYSKMAATLRQRALDHFGCLEFIALEENGEEIALSYWPDEASIQAWKADAQHRVAQQLGRDAWYRHYQVEIARVLHQHQWP